MWKNAIEFSNLQDFNSADAEYPVDLADSIDLTR